MNKVPVFYRLVLAVILLSTWSVGCKPSTPQSPVTPTAIPTQAGSLPAPVSAPQQTTPTAAPSATPFGLVSQESLLSYLEEICAIQPYSGWRSAGSRGEAEALAYVERKMGEFPNLQNRGLELERQSFAIYLGIEFWEARLSLVIDGQESELPAEGLRGSRFDRQLAAYFDSDGMLGDAEADPVTATGAPLVVLRAETLYTLAADELNGRVLFLDYALIDRFATSEAAANGSQLMALIDSGLAGVVLVTQYSNKAGESHGASLGDGANFQWEIPARRVPVLYVRLEDLGQAGITSWDDLSRIESAHLRLDADVFSPGQSGNVIARIPGVNSSKAVILGAHVDSPNGPGALDDGSGVAALLEVARVLDSAQIQPPVDVYLAWFGGHEIGTYGSAHFASTHQELLDRTLAMIQFDGLSHPLDGKSARLTLNFTSYGRFGEERLPLPDLLSKALEPQGISLDRLVEYGLIADNSNFDAFDVPNVYLGYMNATELQMRGAGYIHYANHWHDPYDTVELARLESRVFVEMTQVMLSVALETGRNQPDLRVTPPRERRALFVASHTQSDTIATSMLRELGMALAWEGFDVDLIPYGQMLAPADLEDVGIIVLLPALDYPGENTAKWSENELALLNAYVTDGGFLVVVNSANGFVMKRPLDGDNEDARALNTFLEPLGVAFSYGRGPDGEIALAVAEHPLTEAATYLTFYPGNGVPFRMESGLELVQAASHPLVGLADSGERGGQVLVVADLGVLQCDSNGAKNLQFLKNIAHYARMR